MQTADVIVIGGGIWGLSTAYHLARRNAGRVVVLERNQQLAAETTPQSAGQIGQLRGDPVLARAVGYTLDTVSQFAAQTGHDAAFVRSGSIHVALCDERALQFEQLERVAQEIGYPVSRIEPTDITQFAPTVNVDSVRAALHVPNDGYVDAGACALAYGAAARDQGASCLTNCQVTQVCRSGSTWQITTSQGAWQAEHLIITGGAWTQSLTRQIGFTAPMYPIRLQQARTLADGVAESHPVIRVPDESCYIRPERNAYLFGYFDPDPLPINLDQQPPGFSTRDVRPEPVLIRTAIERLTKILPRLTQLSIDEFRQGMMTCTPDGKFVIGPVPDADNVLVATGCGGTGIAASAAIGRWLSEWVCDGAPSEEVAQYDPARFGNQTADDEWLRTAACATSAAYYRLRSSRE